MGKRGHLVYQYGRRFRWTLGRTRGVLVEYMVWRQRYGMGYGFKCPTEDFVQAFEPNDTRLEASVVFDGEMIPGTFGGAPHDFTGGSWNPPTGYMSQKYLIRIMKDLLQRIVMET